MKKNVAGALALIIIIVIPVLALSGGGGDDEEAGDDGATWETSFGEPSGDVIVPINLQGARNVGSFTIELAYDATVLEVTEVKSGDVAKNAMLEYNISSAGRVVMGIVDPGGITGNGSVANMGFTVIDTEGTSSLTLESVETHDATTLVDIINQTSSGSFDGNGDTITAPVIRFPG